MNRKVNVDTTQSVRELIDQATDPETHIVDGDGRTLAVMMTSDRYKRLIDQRFAEAIAQTHAQNQDENPEDVYDFVTETVARVREEQLERDPRAKRNA